MKKIFLLTVVLAAFTTAFAGNELKVPYSVVYEFRRQFGFETAVSWNKIDGDNIRDNIFVGNFIQNGIWSEAFFGENGEFFGAGKSISPDQLPLTLHKQQELRFSGYTPTEAYEYFSKNSVIPVYGLTVKNEKEMLYIKLNEFGEISIMKKVKKKSFPEKF